MSKKHSHSTRTKTPVKREKCDRCGKLTTNYYPATGKRAAFLCNECHERRVSRSQWYGFMEQITRAPLKRHRNPAED